MSRALSRLRRRAPSRDAPGRPRGMRHIGKALDHAWNHAPSWRTTICTLLFAEAPVSETKDAGTLDAVVVDDHADGAELLAFLLAQCGCEVRVASLGLEAMRLLEERRPDLLFLDLGMPEIDGYEVARVVRHRYGSAIRVVAVTGFDTYEAREMAKWAGFDAFISKPYSPQHVQAALRPLTRGA